ncbi:MAG: hypothetical protein CM15mP58_18470 [Burkholderiaceae bacterium]|nr:MAG: hypothetical protein CM15mP58_18470 [Burkholderiaceae bacterium]
MAKLNLYLCFFSAFICQFSLRKFQTIILQLTSIKLALPSEFNSQILSVTHHTFYPILLALLTRDVIKTSDLAPETLFFVLLMYGYDEMMVNYISDRTRSIDDSCHSSSCTGLWTREHFFARSLAILL